MNACHRGLFDRNEASSIIKKRNEVTKIDARSNDEFGMSTYIHLFIKRETLKTQIMTNARRAQRTAIVKKSWVAVIVIDEVTMADKQDTKHIGSSVWLSASERPRRRAGYKRLQKAVNEGYFGCERYQQN